MGLPGLPGMKGDTGVPGLSGLDGVRGSVSRNPLVERLKKEQAKCQYLGVWIAKFLDCKDQI